MKRIHLVLTIMILGMLISSCGAIPTLPSLESTVTLKTPHFTVDPGLSEPTGQVIHQEPTESPVESPSAPPETVAVQPQPTATDQLPPETAPATEESEETATLEPTLVSSPTAISYPYTLQPLNPHYLGNFSRPDLGCAWMGIGGQIFNQEGAVQKDIIIKAGGELDGIAVIEEMTMPLAEPENDIVYGPGGFEITLANSPVASDSTIWIQLFSLEGTPLSEQIFLITYDDCQKNLLLMNFIEQ